MWKRLPSTKPYFLAFVQETGYYIYVTDYINIWWTNYSKKEFLNILKTSNDDLEMEDNDQFVQLGIKMLLYPENLKKLNLRFEEKTMCISMTLSCPYPVYLDIKLTEGSREMFFERITQQLLKTVQDLKASESELRFALIKKDKEIEEYKTETDVRLAMYLKTAIFHDEEHMAKHTLFQKNFGSSDVPECLLETVVNKPENHTIKEEKQPKEEINIKSEPDSQMVIKSEPESHIKSEPESQVPEKQNVLCTETVKREIKVESDVSPRKRLRKMLKI